MDFGFAGGDAVRKILRCAGQTAQRWCVDAHLENINFSPARASWANVSIFYRVAILECTCLMLVFFFMVVCECTIQGILRPFNTRVLLQFQIKIPIYIVCFWMCISQPLKRRQILHTFHEFYSGCSKNISRVLGEGSW